MKKLNLIAGFMMLSAYAIGQSTTVSFKPGPSLGQDAIIWRLNDDCIHNGYPTTPATVNYGNYKEALFTTWTWSENGCGLGDIRMLIRFSQLNTIPPTATITSAQLILKGPNPTENWGNNYYSGTPLLNDNKGWLKRVIPGSSLPNNWLENTVTWNTAPNTDPIAANWVSIPLTNSRYSWTQTINVTNLVQNIVNELGSDPYANNGFLLMLQNENTYRQQCYASSDYPDSTLWPELKITYKLSCDADFTLTNSTTNPYTYSFIANNSTMSMYEWKINGVISSSASSFNYSFPGPGTYSICLNVTDSLRNKCSKCFNLCISQNNGVFPLSIDTFTHDPITSAIYRGDNPENILSTIKVNPNPTYDIWNVVFNAKENITGEIVIYDIKNKIVKKFDSKIKNGENKIQIEASGLSAGTYIIEIKGTNEILRAKAIKN